METLKYTVIKTIAQYNAYCDKLESLLAMEDEALNDEIELLTLLIERWDAEHSTIGDRDPVELLKALMKTNGLKSKDLAGILNLSKGTVSKILNYRKGLSKESIRNLAAYFKLSQEAFNRPYELVDQPQRKRRISINKTSPKSGLSFG